MAAQRVLVAGIGNVFLGDDAFGVEVATTLAARAQREGVRVVDFGIRGIDLAFALERCDAAILVDAMARGGAPGTLYVVEPVIEAGAPAELETHAMTPDRLLRWLAPEVARKVVRVVGCEPESFGEEDEGRMGLSAPVLAAVGPAADLVARIAGDLARGGPGDA